jgi:hypothetical protein
MGVFGDEAIDVRERAGVEAETRFNLTPTIQLATGKPVLCVAGVNAHCPA